jgi:4-amino-4-deoxy-L-arabinose transferase-like glycosyltransferase
MRDLSSEPERESRTPQDAWLLVACGVALALRLIQFGAPLADAHRWRQVENAAVAWNFHVRGINPFYPEVNWGGPGPAWVQMEFPLLPALMAVGYSIAGERESVGRLIVVASSIGLIVAIFALGAHLFGRAAARAAALLVAVSPTAVFFGRVPMADTPAIAAATLALLAALIHVDGGHRRWAVAAGGSLAVALLLKPTTALVLAPIAWAAWRQRGWTVWRDWSLIGAVLVPILATAAWHWHAESLYQQTGLTLGVWRRWGTLPPEVAAVAAPSSSPSAWATYELLVDSGFYEQLLRRFWTLHLTPVGVIIGLLGAVISRRTRGGRVCFTWVGAGIVYMVALASGNLAHEYYQLPVLPPMALLFGVAAAPIFDSAWIARLEGGYSTRIGIGVLAVGSGVLCFYMSGVVGTHFRREALEVGPTVMGAAVARATPADAVLITIDNAAGPNSPILLYHARRRGWSLDLATASPHTIEHLRRRGATHFATTLHSQVRAVSPEMATYLRPLPVVRLEGAPDDCRLFDLR